MAKIYAPNPRYSGISASVNFVNGVGETDDPRLIKWFKSKGYKVEDVKKTTKKTETKSTKTESKAENKPASKTKAQTTNKK